VASIESLPKELLVAEVFDNNTSPMCSIHHVFGALAG
jgi:hypothetical protein